MLHGSETFFWQYVLHVLVLSARRQKAPLKDYNVIILAKYAQVRVKAFKCSWAVMEPTLTFPSVFVSERACVTGISVFSNFTYLFLCLCFHILSASLSFITPSFFIFAFRRVVRITKCATWFFKHIKMLTHVTNRRSIANQYHVCTIPHTVTAYIVYLSTLLNIPQMFLLPTLN